MDDSDDENMTPRVVGETPSAHSDELNEEQHEFPIPPGWGQLDYQAMGFRDEAHYWWHTRAVNNIIESLGRSRRGEPEAPVAPDGMAAEVRLPPAAPATPPNWRPVQDVRGGRPVYIMVSSEESPPSAEEGPGSVPPAARPYRDVPAYPAPPAWTPDNDEYMRIYRRLQFASPRTPPYRPRIPDAPPETDRPESPDED